MPVKLTNYLEPEYKTLCCNTTAVSLHLNKISHWIPGSPSPGVVLKPIIDTLSLTISAEKAYAALPITPKKAGTGEVLDRDLWWNTVVHRFEAAAKSADEVHLGSGSRRPRPYDRHFDMILESSRAKPLFSFRSKPGHKRRLRLETNIHTLGLKGLEELEARWAQLAGPFVPFRALLPDAPVTRVDVAVDFLNVSLANVFAHHPKLWKLWCCSDPDTGAQTLLHFFKPPGKKSEHQSFKKPAELSIYDKRVEQLSRDTEPEYGDLPHTRIELRQNTQTFLQNLGKSFQTKLVEWSIVRAGLEDTAEQAAQRRALDSIRVRGYPDAR
ncbi:MAG: hypothetical protein AAGH87_10685 [Pseudomonadota bacterium]